MDPKVKAYLEKKYGFAQGLADEDITAAQDQAQSTMRTANMGEAADQIGAAIAGTKADASYWDKQRQDADRGVKDIKDRRQGMMQNMQFGDATTQAADQDDLRTRLNDPASQETLIRRQMLKKLSPNANADSLTGAQIDQMLPSFQKIYQIDNENDRIAEDRAYRRQALGLQHQSRADAIAARREEKDIERTEKKKLSVGEVENRRQNIEDNLNLLEKMIDEKGTYEMFGSHNADLDRRVEAIATDMAKLADPDSVARPSEVEAFKKGLIKASATDMKNSTAKDILKNFRSEVAKRADNAYQVRGLANPGPRTDSAPPAAKEVERRDPKTGKTAIFDAETKQFIRYKE